MNAAIALSIVLFGGDVDKMGSPDFHVREKASQRAVRLTPLNLASLQKGMQSKDPEVRRRCRDAARPWLQDAQIARQGYRELTLAYRVLRPEGDWNLSEEEGQAIANGSYAMHMALVKLARERGWMHKDESAPCEYKDSAYYTEAMVGFVLLMRRRARGLPDYVEP